MRELTLWTVGTMFGKEIPHLGKRSRCPIRSHKRKDKGFKVFEARSGAILYKCFSCDAPYDIGDAVGLYAALANTDRREAWNKLKDDGYDVPGLDSNFTARRASPRPPPMQVTPVRGELARGEPVLVLDLQRWQVHVERREGTVERFAEQRGLDAQFLRQCDVVDIDHRCVGFGYRDPVTHIPCRVKVRPLDKKMFWIEPRPAEGQRGKALAPLYLAHRLMAPRRGLGAVAVITEGEPDALALVQAGIRNVVSLPDGASSAAHVDLRPLMDAYPLWLLATDDDESGHEAARVLAARATRVGCSVGPVFWERDGRRYKDANEAWQEGGMRKDQLLACMAAAAKETLGYEVNVA